MKNIYSLIIAVIALTGIVHAQNCAVCGFWFPEESHNSIIEIFEEGGELKGKVSWMAKPNLPNGQPILDSMNKKASLRTRPVVDMVFLYGFEKDGDTWEKGKVYDSRTGKTYSAEIKLTDKGQLKLTGYVGFSWIGKSVYWDRTESK